MQRLRSEFGVYGTDAGRMCVAALNSGILSMSVRVLPMWFETVLGDKEFNVFAL